MVMIRQRDPSAAPAVRASATNLPFRDGTFDASLAVLTVHHWPDLERGLQELRGAPPVGRWSSCPVTHRWPASKVDLGYRLVVA